MPYEFGSGTRAKPGIFDKDFLFLQALSRELERAIAALHGDALAVVDVGSTWKPYRVLFGPRARRFLAVDIGPPTDMDVVGSADRLPLAGGSADVCLCTQVLEHVEDPAAVIAELSRVVKHDGVVLLSTHGVFHHHPYPHDYWRWTSEGLEKIMRERFRQVEVRANGGTLLLLCHVVGRGIYHAAEHRPLLRFLRYTVYPLVNLAGLALNALIRDRSLSVNYLAIARDPVRGVADAS